MKSITETFNIEKDVFITGAHLGDFDKDGKTDILVQLSNGAAYVFEQTGNRRPPVSTSKAGWNEMTP